jgi:transcriptional regulator with XRE-family HTH domain
MLLVVSGWDILPLCSTGKAARPIREPAATSKAFSVTHLHPREDRTVDDRERIARARHTVRRAAYDRMNSLDLTQVDLADRAEVSYKTVSRFFNADGWREPQVIRAISEALGWPADELERRVEVELARQAIPDLEATVPGLIALQLDPALVSGLAPEEANELRAVLSAVAVQQAAAIRARTPGRGFPLMTPSHLLTVGA